MRRRLLIAILILAVALTGVVPIGGVAFHLDKDTYHPGDGITITLRSFHTGIVQFGLAFEVQRFDDGSWVEVPLDLIWRLPSMHLYAGEAFRQSLVPAEDFSETPKPGRYRVVKEVQVGPIHAGAVHETRILYAEFRIEAPISEQQGPGA